MEHKEKLTLVKPITEDPLYKNLLALPEDVKALAKCSSVDKMNFKLKTRLLMDD
jgi:hypothetical protein